MISLVGHAVAVNADRRLEILATAYANETNDVWFLRQNGYGQDQWDQWRSLGSPPGGFDPPPGGGEISVARNADGRLEAAVIRYDMTVWHAWQVTPGGPWSGWASLGKSDKAGSRSSGPVLALGANGCLSLLVEIAGVIWHRRQRSVSRSPWTPWESLGTIPGEHVRFDRITPVVDTNVDGRLEVFFSQFDELWHVWQTTPGGNWSPWASLGQPTEMTSETAEGGAGKPIDKHRVGRARDGRLFVFGSLPDGTVCCRSQQFPGRTPWTPWAALPLDPDGHRREIAVGRQNDGRLAVFAMAAAPAQPQPTWLIQQAEQDDTWTTAKIGGMLTPPDFADKAVTQPQVVSDADGRLVLVGRVQFDTAIYLMAQTEPNGTWLDRVYMPLPAPETGVLELGDDVPDTDSALTITDLQENGIGYVYTAVKDFTGSDEAQVGTQEIQIKDANLTRDSQLFASISEIQKADPGGWAPHAGAAGFSVLSVTPGGGNVTIKIRIEWSGHPDGGLPFRLTYLAFNPAWGGQDA